jgi:type IV pilus assembly protein PilM
MARRVWGIDLGRSAVKGVLMTTADGQPRILDADIVPLEGPPPDPSQDPTRDGRVWKALTRFRREHPLRKCAVCVAIPAQNTFVRQLTVAQVGRRKLEEMVRFEASNEIPFILDQVVWDYTLFEPEPDQVTREGLLVAVKRNVVETYVRVLRQLEVGHMDLITLAPLALLSFLKHELGDEAGALALDLGAENAVMLAVEPGRFWLRNALVGGNRLTTLMQERLDVEFEAAQKAKESIARSRRAREALALLRPGINDLVRTVRTHMSQLERDRDAGRLEATYGLGGTSRLPGLKKHLSSALRRQVEPVRALGRIGLSPEADAEFVGLNLDRLGVAIGAALCGLGHDVAGVSFLPRGEAQLARISRAKGTMLVLALALWAVMLTLYYFGLRIREPTQETLRKYGTLSAIVLGKDRELREAMESAPQEQALQYLLSLPAGKNQPVELVDAAVRAFEEAARRARYGFQLTGFQCAEPEPEAPPPAKEADAEATAPAPEAEGPKMLTGRINGRIVLPRGGTPNAAYRLFARELLDGLRAVKPFRKAAGRATFVNGERTVRAEGEGWPDSVRRGDMLRPGPAGAWLTVESVASPTELLLAEPYPGEDAEAECTICRVLPAEFNTESLEFAIRFEVPDQGPPDVNDLLQAAEG